MKHRCLTSHAAVGLALAGDRVIAHSTRRGSASDVVWNRPLNPSTLDGRWDDLASALLELRAELAMQRGRIAIALLPDLVQVKSIELPKMTDAEMRTVLKRDAGRFFFDVREPQVVGFQTLPNGRRPLRRLLVAATPTRVIDGVMSAALESGWEIRWIIPAYAAWAAAAAWRWPQLRRGTGYIVATLGALQHTMEISDGHLKTLRRAPAGQVEVSDTVPLVLDAADVAAAMYARDARDLELLPERVHSKRSRRVRTVGRSLVAAAAACFIASAVLELWGTQRELRQIESKRSAIRSRVDGIMKVRETLDVVDRRTGALVMLDRTAPQWSGTMATVASHLPLDAHLAAFRGRADSLVLEGVADRAAPVFEAIQRAPGVTSVKATAPIRQELDADQRPVESFSVALRLVPAGAVSGGKP